MSLDVSRETTERLAIHANLLRKWNPKINLVSSDTLEALEARHIEDSAQVLSLAPENARSWVDLGSGAGFPGLVVAALAAERKPALSVALIEADLRKATFLRTVAREAGLQVTVLAERIEEAAPQGADVVSARALAPLPKLLPLAARHMGEGGIGLFHKGARHAEETRAALALWRFRCETVASKTDAAAVIMKISELSVE